MANHADGEPGGEVPGGEGARFGNTCEVIPAPSKSPLCEALDGFVGNLFFTYDFPNTSIKAEEVISISLLSGDTFGASFSSQLVPLGSAQPIYKSRTGFGPLNNVNDPSGQTGFRFTTTTFASIGFEYQLSCEYEAL